MYGICEFTIAFLVAIFFAMEFERYAYYMMAGVAILLLIAAIERKKGVALLLCFSLIGCIAGSDYISNQKRLTLHAARFKIYGEVEKLHKSQRSKLEFPEISILKAYPIKGKAQIPNIGNVLLKLHSKESCSIGDIVEGEFLLRKSYFPENIGLPTPNKFKTTYSAEQIGEFKKIGSSHRWKLSRIAERLKQHFLKAISQRHKTELAAILTGITLGEKSLFTPELTEIFVTTGTIHLLAASGMNISAILFLLIWILKKLKLHPLIYACTILPVILLYTHMAGGGGIARAGMMSGIHVVATLSNRENRLENSLSLTLIFLVGCNPQLIFDVGFILSALAILGLLLANRYIIPEIQSSGKMKAILDALIMSLCIELVALPIMINCFNRWSPISPIINIIAAPITILTLYTGLIEGIFSGIPIFGWISRISDLLAQLLFKMLYYFHNLPYSSISLPSVPIWSIVLYYTGIVCGLKYSPKKIIVLLCSGVLICFSLYSSEATNRLDHITLDFLSCNNGDCAIIESDNGKRVIVDTGPSLKTASISTGDRILAPFLLKEGVRTVDLCLISHRDDDHAGGYTDLAKRIRIQEVYTNRNIEKPPYEIALSQNVKLKILAPLSFSGIENRDSMVVLLEYGGVKALFTGDLDSAGERSLLEKYPNLQATILKVAHHGSITGSSEQFLNQINAKYGVISCGYGNHFGHPSKEVVKRLTQHGCRVYRTDLNGGVRICIAQNGAISVQTARTQPIPEYKKTL